jgi:hypothetical protein
MADGRWQKWKAQISNWKAEMGRTSNIRWKTEDETEDEDD